MCGPRRAAALAIIVAATTVAATTVACSSSTPEDTSAFCAAATDATAPGGSIDAMDLSDPDSVNAAAADLDRLADLAPDPVASDARVVSDVYREVLDALVATVPGAREDTLRELQPRLDEAARSAESLVRYAGTTCGVTFPDPAQPTPTPTPLNLDD